MPLDKPAARKRGLSARAALSGKVRKEKDACIARQVIGKIRDIHTVGCYVSMKDEADTHAIIAWCLAHNKTVCVPKVEGDTLVFHRIESLNELAEGTFHVMEPVRNDPVEPEEIGFMIVPLSAFDDNNNRTGYGRGYYDSILKRCAHKAGIGYAEQKCEEIECDPWDVRLDEVIYA